MKASRLLSIVLLLQTRGRMTARQLADELEVSVRTVYRDIDALQLAGIPLYGDAGPAGGYRLVNGYRTRLTGLTPAEARAVPLLGLPGPAAELGLGSEFAGAVLKLQAAMPDEAREHVDETRARFHFDRPGWYEVHQETPYLARVAHAVWHSRVLRVRYRRWATPTEVQRRLEPLGLILKAGRWYLVAGPRPRTYRVDQIIGLELSDERFDPPRDFDLVGHWGRYLADFRARMYTAQAVVRFSTAAIPELSDPMARAVTETGRMEADGWIRATVPIESSDHAERVFLALGTDAEVLAPETLRVRLAETTRLMAGRYCTSV